MKNDRLAITHSMALTMCANEGLINETNFKYAQLFYDAMLKDLKQPLKGYFYADDVSKFITKQYINNLPPLSEEIQKLNDSELLSQLLEKAA
jgi:hypothetical protein